MFGKNRRHENVGRTFYFPYFKRNIEVVAYSNDGKWWFCFEGTRYTPEYEEFRAESKLSYFIENGYELEADK